MRSLTGAFYYCYKLVEIYNLSSHITVTKRGYGNGCLGYYALDVYTSLDEDSKLTTDENGYILYDNGIDRYLIGYKGNQTELTLPANINGQSYKIYQYAFNYYNDKMTSVIISDSVTSIGYSAFEYCRGLTSIVIPDSVTSIGDRAFFYCTGLTSVTIGDSVTSIGYEAFEGCTNLIQKENGVSYVDKWVVDCYTSVASVTLRVNTVGIADSAFYGCTGLTSVTIGSGVTSIGSCAFSGCTGLTSISIPNSVTSIGSFAFSGCTGLTSVTFEDTSTWYYTDDYNNWNNKTGGTQIDVTNPTTNASNLTSAYTYYSKYWYKI